MLPRGLVGLLLQGYPAVGRFLRLVSVYLLMTFTDIELVTLCRTTEVTSRGKV